MHKVLLFIILVLTGLAGCSGPNEKVVVATAANLQHVMPELKAAFESQSDSEIEIQFGSSGQLSTRIREGAPIDIFVSADTLYPYEIHRNGGSDAPPQVYARGTLVLWTLDSTTTTDLSLSTLLGSSVSKIALANPATAPFGQAAVQAMQQAGIYEQVKDRLLYAENTAQVTQQLTSGAAGAGFTALSIVLSPAMKGKGRWIKIDSAAYRPLVQAAVLLRHNEDSFKRQPSRDFFEFLYSEKAKAIFRNYGYAVD
ncbi:molybdate ABC transporter substrate-binding protein [Telluribacter sp.]|jgi:molybdate transport system substrate-binding protein|uniref:molybdate ABC transporter substrate-binding protein n=1 Tax=Telluribacter sp. TaxID=1978767 RepID=UPI002E12F120|nr:molybdate ABC transporter substrate-binding protein [Telluribacter sp.]